MCIRKTGFTILELLVVMVIMAIMMGVAISSNFGITRGMEFRSAVDHLRSTVLHARQTAILTGREIYVVFDQQETNANYTICQYEGTVTDIGAGGAPSRVFVDEFSDLSNMASNSVIFNLSNLDNPSLRRTVIYTVEDMGGWYAATTSNSVWRVGDKYGWQIFPDTSLPRGYKFGNGDPNYTVPTVKFKPDGSTDQDFEIDICEAARSQPGDPFTRITVRRMTGSIMVEHFN
ncbi:MAG: prepilin-type N-terminal cleavage/methylation domain-containing protein [Lentisphaerae bacterium]|nr:prepilin-type N-terminal cleavage/methylation domain-containing protein [Lentisphaerota bacterium]